MDEEAPSKPPIYVMIKFNDQASYVIGEVKDESIYDVVLHWPMQMGIYYDEEGLNVYCRKYMPFAYGDVISVLKNSINSLATPKAEFIAYYLKFRQKWQGEAETDFEHRVFGIKKPDAVPTLTPEPRPKDTPYH